MFTLELSEINQIFLGKLGLVLPVALRSDLNEEITCQSRLSDLIKATYHAAVHRHSKWESGKPQ